MQYLVLVRSVHAHVLRRAVIRYLVVEGGKLRHFDEVAETLLLHHVVRHVELKVGGLLGEYRRPRIETADVLPLQLLRAQVLEQEVQLRQRVADGRAGEERSSQIFARALLYGADGEEHIESLLASFRVAQSRYTVVARVEGQIFELVRFIYEDVVDAHLFEIHHVVRARLDGVFHLLQFSHKVVLALLQPFQYRPRHVLSLLTQHFEVFLHRVKLRLQDTLLQLR